MSKIKVDAKYADLIEYSTLPKGSLNSSYENVLFVHDDTKSIISTDGHRMLAVRNLYDEVKVVSRLVGESKALSLNDKGVLESNSRSVPDFSGILPTETKLKEEYRKVFLKVPAWLEGISKKEKKTVGSIILADSPILAIGEGYKDSTAIDLKYLKFFAGQELDIHVSKKGLDIFVILPHGQEFNAAPWFSLIASLKPGKTELPSYL